MNAPPDAELRAAMIAILEEMSAAGVRTPADARELGNVLDFTRDVAVRMGDRELRELTEKIRGRWARRLAP